MKAWITPSRNARNWPQAETCLTVGIGGFSAVALVSCYGCGVSCLNVRSRRKPISGPYAAN